MKAIELKKRLERLIVDYGEDVKVEVSVDVGSDEDPYKRVFGSPIGLQSGTGFQPAVILCEEVEEKRQ